MRLLFFKNLKIMEQRLENNFDKTLRKQDGLIYTASDISERFKSIPFKVLKGKYKT
jgi:hypothetical protein